MSRASFVALELSAKEHEELLRVAAMTDDDEDDNDNDDNNMMSSTSIVSNQHDLDNLVENDNDDSARTTGRIQIILDYCKRNNLSRLLKRYVSWLDSNPLFARCVTCAVTATIGSILSSRRTVPISSNSSRRRNHGSANNTNINHHHLPTKTTIDWLEVLAFALHGGFVAGPTSYYIDTFLEENFYDSQSSLVLFDQVVVTPVQLLLMFVCLDSSKAAMKSLPSSLSKSWSMLGSTVSESWAVWPVSIYLLLKVLKKRRHYLAAINLCSIAWVARLAKKRQNGLLPSGNV